MKLSMLGPPGSGKSTQAELLSARCGPAHIYPGKLLRREAQSSSPFAERIRSYLEAGLLVTSDIVLALLERAILESHGNYILDGFPRNIEQAIELEILLMERGESLDALIYLEVSREEVFARLLRRGRPDDTVDLIEKRLRVFHAETDPVIEFYQEKGALIHICGEGETDEISREILRSLQARLPTTTCT